jgi:hypothetical protein
MKPKISADVRARGPRIAVAAPAILIESDGCVVDVTVLDVSSSGFRISSNAELTVDEEVQLQIGKGKPVRAVICWTRGVEAGGNFIDPPEELD